MMVRPNWCETSFFITPQISTRRKAIVVRVKLVFRHLEAIVPVRCFSFCLLLSFISAGSLLAQASSKDGLASRLGEYFDCNDGYSCTVEYSDCVLLIKKISKSSCTLPGQKKEDTYQYDLRNIDRFRQSERFIYVDFNNKHEKALIDVLDKSNKYTQILLKDAEKSGFFDSQKHTFELNKGISENITSFRRIEYCSSDVEYVPAFQFIAISHESIEFFDYLKF